MSAIGTCGSRLEMTRRAGIGLKRLFVESTNWKNLRVSHSCNSKSAKATSMISRLNGHVLSISVQPYSYAQINVSLCLLKNSCCLCRLTSHQTAHESMCVTRPQPWQKSAGLQALLLQLYPSSTCALRQARVQQPKILP